MSAALRFVSTAALWSVLAAAVALALATSFPSLAGYRAFNVQSGSMEPTLEVGSVVLDETIRAREAGPGDVVTFPDPNADRQLTHRVQRITFDGGTVHVVTKGDVNDAPERWDVPLDDEIGRVAYHLPKLGYARAWIAGGPGRLGAALLVLLWGVAAVRDIWRTPSPAPARTAPDAALEGSPGR
jgi:signal peptidase